MRPLIVTDIAALPGMKTAFLLFISAFFWLSSAFAGLTCPDLFAEGLHADAKAALLDAARNGYKARVMHGTVSGRRKTIVVLGEAHFKDKTQSELGLNVLREFPFRGLEGFEAKEYWFPKVLEKASEPVFEFMRNFSKEKEIPERSTVFEAEDQETQMQAFMAMRERLLKVMEEKISTGRISKEQFLAKAKNYSFVLPQQGRISMADMLGDQAVAKFSDLLKIKPEDRPLVRDFNPILNVHLEVGKNKPDWYSNLVALHFMSGVATLLKIGKVGPIVTAGCAMGACIATIGDLGPVSSGAIGAGVGAASTLAYGLSAKMSLPKFKNNRDKLMTANLIEALKLHQDQDTILVIVGSDHLPGMMQILADMHGFKEDIWAFRDAPKYNPLKDP